MSFLWPEVSPEYCSWSVNYVFFSGGVQALWLCLVGIMVEGLCHPLAFKTLFEFVWNLCSKSIICFLEQTLLCKCTLYFAVQIDKGHMYLIVKLKRTLCNGKLSAVCVNLTPSNQRPDTGNVKWVWEDTYFYPNYVLFGVDKLKVPNQSEYLL